MWVQDSCPNVSDIAETGWHRISLLMPFKTIPQVKVIPVYRSSIDFGLKIESLHTFWPTKTKRINRTPKLPDFLWQKNLLKKEYWFEVDIFRLFPAQCNDCGKRQGSGREREYWIADSLSREMKISLSVTWLCSRCFNYRERERDRNIIVVVYLFPGPQLRRKTYEIDSGVISKCCPKPAEMPRCLNCCVSDMQKA